MITLAPDSSYRPLNETFKVELIIRRANYDDLKEILSLFTDTIQHICQKDYDQNQIKAWCSASRDIEKWKEYIATQSIYVAIHKKNMVGFGSLQNGNYIHLLYVHKSFIRSGIGTALFKKLEKESREKGFDYLTSDVSITARPFFEYKGFKMVAKNRKVINGAEIINYHMSQ